MKNDWAGGRACGRGRISRQRLECSIVATPKRWLVTGAAGFIGSHLVAKLLTLDQPVVGLDNFYTGYASNLADVAAHVTPVQWSRFSLIQGDIRDFKACRLACEGVDVILHQAALGSVPRSIEDPVTTDQVNIGGFVNVLKAAHLEKVQRVVYASSSAVYGDSMRLPKREDEIGSPLSPYAVTKLANERYAGVFARIYGLESIGLRYFNVFGPRQDPHGPYSAVIPRWISALSASEPVLVNGDGLASRDFTYVGNVVHANLLAAVTVSCASINQVYNVGLGEQSTLSDLLGGLKEIFQRLGQSSASDVVHGDARLGDVRHSIASLEKISRLLGYESDQGLMAGLSITVPWYLDRRCQLR